MQSLLNLLTTVVDSVFSIVGNLDASKKMVFQVDTQATASTLTYDVGAQTAGRTVFTPVLTANATFAVLTEAQTFSGAKTFTATTTFNNTTSANIDASPTVPSPAFTYVNVFHPTVSGTPAGAVVGNSFWLTTTNNIVGGANSLFGVELVGRFGAAGGAGGGAASVAMGLSCSAANTGLSLTELTGATIAAANSSGTATTAIALSLNNSNAGTLGTGIALRINGNAGTTKQAIAISAGCGPIIQGDTTASTTTTTGALQVAGGAGIAGAVNAGGDIATVVSATRFAKISGVNGTPSEFRIDDNSNVQIHKLSNGGMTGTNQGVQTLVALGDSGVLRASWALFNAFAETIWTATAGTQNASVSLQAAGAGLAVEFMRGLSTGAALFGSDPGGTDRVRINGALTINSATLIQTKTAFTNGAAAAVGTLNNAPAAGNPTKWIPINDNGTTRFIPAW